MNEPTGTRKPPKERVIDLRAGDLGVRLAETQTDVDAALSLRYRVFYEEMKARPTPEMAARKQDFDRFDEFCDHLLVIDHAHDKDTVVGTYRLIRGSVAMTRGGFYTEDEYIIDKLIDYPGEVLELGRSCVDIDYRTRSTMQMLWAGIAAYVLRYDLVLMFGCASLPGTDPNAVAHQLAYLYHYHLAPPAIRPIAVRGRYVDMRRVPEDQVDPRRAIGELPPLVKGYLRLGAFVGDGAVVDDQFNTVDVCIVVKTDWVTEKYLRHYSRGDREGPHS